jgi:NTP pyrophosphatase (non-canonical NTP hydrolase)
MNIVENITEYDYRDIAVSGDDLTLYCFSASHNAGWWTNANTANKETIATKLMLIVSEVAEAMEGLRKNLKDDKLPEHDMIEVELADAAIRIFDLAGALGYENFGGTIAKKMQFNASRADHKPENRAKVGGKAF